ncbi:MAG: tryptophan-rich sensory protein [Flavobacteriales bacterium]|nr:tryptophan-rich sensory protein [Flavobacteriales bacterium]
MVRLKTFFVFFILNFGGLFLGGLFTGSGVSSEWYSSLNQAPWTPPGWVFGAAWTSIMFCFTFYLTRIYIASSKRKNLILLYSVQWLLNVFWNPIFFHFHFIALGLLTIFLLTAVLICFFILFTKRNYLNKALILPYIIWLIIATSLNSYIYFNN